MKIQDLRMAAEILKLEVEKKGGKALYCTDLGKRGSEELVDIITGQLIEANNFKNTIIYKEYSESCSQLSRTDKFIILMADLNDALVKFNPKSDTDLSEDFFKARDEIMKKWFEVGFKLGLETIRSQEKRKIEND